MNSSRVTFQRGPFKVLLNCGSSDPGGFVSSSSQTEQSAAPIPPPFRRYECQNYETCLDLAAALDWESFSCQGCCGKVNECLFWQAHQAEKYDQVVGVICDHLPPLSSHKIQNAANTPDPVDPETPLAIKR